MYKNVTSSPFIEHPVVDIAQLEANEFDIYMIEENQPTNFISKGQFNRDLYCKCLLYKLYNFPKSKIKPFIKYQCELLAEPFIWLNKLEKLIDLNRELFTTKEQKIKTEKALMIIELLRQEIENNKFNVLHRFDFDKLKARIKNYQNSEEKLFALYEAQAEYLQNKPKVIDPTETLFDEKCSIEIDKIEKLEQLKKRMPERNAIFNKQPLKHKIVIRGHINILVDAFYQMLHEKKANGLPYLDVNTPDLIHFITSNFADKDGYPLSESTVRTILSPNRAEKRPKNDNKIQL